MHQSTGQSYAVYPHGNHWVVAEVPHARSGRWAEVVLNNIYHDPNGHEMIWPQWTRSDLSGDVRWPPPPTLPLRLSYFDASESAPSYHRHPQLLRISQCTVQCQLLASYQWPSAHLNTTRYHQQDATSRPFRWWPLPGISSNIGPKKIIGISLE
jgi:hypothetical protein